MDIRKRLEKIPLEEGDPLYRWSVPVDQPRIFDARHTQTAGRRTEFGMQGLVAPRKLAS
jgi:hypothetical protein